MNRTATIIMAILMAICCNSAMAAKKPLKVYILAGQSNMEGHVKIETFDYVGEDPATAPMLKEMRGPDGKPRVCEKVWISYLTGSGDKLGEGFGKLKLGYGARSNPAKSDGNLGPEFTFGIYMHKTLDEPILIIKTAWGGKDLYCDFRPPSAGKPAYEIGQRRGKDREIGLYYRLMINHVKKVLADPKRVCPAYNAKDGYEIAGFVWFQGWNDMCAGNVYPNRNEPGGYAEYTRLMAHFIRDVRKELSTPKMRFVIGVIGVHGNKAKGPLANIRPAMAAPAEMPEFKGNVAAVQTAPYWEYLTPIETKLAILHNMKMKLLFKEPKYANKDGKMTKAQQEAYLKEYNAKVVKLTPKEEALYKRVTSNSGMHYFGSAKIVGQIGKAFAEAMLKMEKN